LKHPRTGQWCRMSSTNNIGGPECGAWVDA
jgi:hypothetical protein